MNGLDTIKNSMSGLELLKISEGEFPWLVENLIPMYGVGALVGESETGKSTFLRQLSLSIARGDEDFLGLTLNAKNQKALYVSTEDEQVATAHWLGKHLGYHKNDEGMDQSKFEYLTNLNFIFETENLENSMIEELEKGSVDLIVIDAFSDVFSKDINATNAVRTFINGFFEIAKDYQCFVLFLHHYGKSNQKSGKNRVLGSQGFEGKMRVLLSLERKNENNLDLKIIKHNYLSNEEKLLVQTLKLNHNLCFINEGKNVRRETCKKKNKTKPEIFIEKHGSLLQSYIDHKITADTASEMAKEKGFEISAGSISKAKKIFLGEK